MAMQNGWTIKAASWRWLTLSLGDKTLGVSSDYKNAKMPPVNEGLLDGHIAWRQHDGGHTDAPNVKYFIEWVNKFMGRTMPPE
jgi:hypothetical protein